MTGARVRSLEELEPWSAVLLDLTPRQVLEIAGDELPGQLDRFRYGPGVFKVDWALSEPIPWTARPCRRAGTVHVGGRLEEIESSARAAWEGRSSERPFVLTVERQLERFAPGFRDTVLARSTRTAAELETHNRI